MTKAKPMNALRRLQRVVENTLLSLFFINSSMDVVALDKDRSGQSTGLGC
jgi:hypothetical protein